MLRVRRYRVYLLVTAFSLFTVYIYSREAPFEPGSWQPSRPITKTEIQPEFHPEPQTFGKTSPPAPEQHDEGLAADTAKNPYATHDELAAAVANTPVDVPHEPQSADRPSGAHGPADDEKFPQVEVPRPPGVAKTRTSSSSTRRAAAKVTGVKDGDKAVHEAQPTQVNSMSPDDYGGLYNVTGPGSLIPATPTIHWSKPVERYPVSSLIRLPTGQPIAIKKIQAKFEKELALPKKDREEKQAQIKDAMKRTWAGYRKYAWLHDELRPVSNSTKNGFNGWAATLVDSLDTLYIMGMTKEFEEAVNATQHIDFTISRRYDIPLFETTIRYLGGLLGAYDVSGGTHDILLAKAIELGEILMGVFDTPNRMPVTYYEWEPERTSEAHQAGFGIVIAELGTLFVEFTRLAQVSREPKYYDAVARIGDALYQWQNLTSVPGMWPVRVDATGCAHTAERISTLAQGPPDRPVGTPVRQDAAHNASDVQPSPAPGKSSPEPVLTAGDDKVAVTDDLDKQDGPDPRKDFNTFGTDRIDETETLVEGSDLFREKDKSSFGTDGGLGKRQEDKHDDIRDSCVPTGLQSAGYGSDRYTLGGESDSAYEYMPKEWLMLGGLEDKYRTMYETSLDAWKKHLLARVSVPDGRRLMFTGEFYPSPSNDSKKIDGTFKADTGHLACFLGGMVGMGARLFDRPDELALASQLTDGCVWAYEKTASGIMPESFSFLPCDDINDCKWNQTQWEMILDPAGGSRTAVAQKAIELVSAQDMAIDVLTDAMPGAPPTVSKIRLEDLDKRQLDEPAPDPLPGQRAHAEAEPTSPLAVPAHVPPTRAKPDEPPAPRPPGHQEVHTSDGDGFDLAIQPQRPLTHKEFVNRRIEAEGLWPGITGIRDSKYILRPEAIESVFYMYRITGDESWRVKGWNMFQAIEKATRTNTAYSAIGDVTKESSYKTDSMESFWPAETLKYFYLLFSEPDFISLDEYVFNTEAHPLRRPDAPRRSN